MGSRSSALGRGRGDGRGPDLERPRSDGDSVGDVGPDNAARTDGDTVTVSEDLKVKGSSLVVKVGTKVKNIRLADGFGGHDIDCKIDGIGAMQLKSEFVRKS